MAEEKKKENTKSMQLEALSKETKRGKAKNWKGISNSFVYLF